MCVMYACLNVRTTVRISSLLYSSSFNCQNVSPISQDVPLYPGSQLQWNISTRSAQLVVEFAMQGLLAHSSMSITRTTVYILSFLAVSGVLISSINFKISIMT